MMESRSMSISLNDKGEIQEEKIFLEHIMFNMEVFTIEILSWWMSKDEELK